jgi:hypothetical protein
MKRFDDDPDRPELLRWDPVHGVATFGDSIPDDPCTVDVECPHGAEGDGLYVKETQWRNGGYVATDQASFKNEGKKPSIFMRRTESRIDLEIVNVRPERLHEITEADAKAEGVEPLEHVSPLQPLAGEGIPAEPQPHRVAFGCLWDEINGDRKDGVYRWIRNVWLWRVEFGRIA